MLRCPRSRKPLRYLPASAGRPEALLCVEERLLYRIEEGVPILLAEEAQVVAPEELETLLAYLPPPLGQ